MTDKKPRLRDPVKEQQMWKVYIQSEDDGAKIWKHNWGWILDEYKCLKKTLDEKTEQSTFLAAVKEEVKEDNRKLSKIPESINHFYGWVAKEEDFKLEKYGPDYFKALQLPDIFKLIK
ncbi:uncharacterized protein LOC108912814 [Anoplophora glabripennis]|uniref:uncharacterized protein LOC108912814 n=1 Tax=Anoplophora glabripennis TaxID=217634 RepID=UPI000875506C|nr:uncharacterized protein LOC108912814 [Anoplophora glabripennis]